jgi:hypothetical protein
MIGAQRREREKEGKGREKGTIAHVFSGGLWVYWRRSGIEWDDWTFAFGPWAVCGA